MRYDVVTDGSDLRVGIGSSERRHQVVALGRPDRDPFKHGADEIGARRNVHPTACASCHELPENPDFWGALRGYFGDAMHLKRAADGGRQLSAGALERND